MRRVLVVADVRWWAFERIYRGLKKYCQDWDVHVHYLRERSKIDHGNFPVVLYLCDWLIDPLYNNQIPREKLILAIRQSGDIGHRIYTVPGELNKRVFMVAASNPGIFEKYSRKHSNVRVAPGGVDTDTFSFKSKILSGLPRIGWAGNVRSWGRQFRGIDILEEACRLIGATFNPALRGVRLRAQKEMVTYYQDEIDIYVDMSESAGRQNGLLEAGSCGCPIISSDAGVARQLIADGVNGFICDRDPHILAQHIRKVMSNYKTFSQSIRKTIEAEWSWAVHALIFEELFEECLKC